jgi:hypothetical protein
MKTIRSLFISIILVTGLAIFFSSCSLNRKLFYCYSLDHNDCFYFNNKLYTVLVNKKEFDKLPKQVSDYLTQIHLAGKQRIPEVLFNYKGVIVTDDFDSTFRKPYTINDHCSGMEVRYETKGHAFPLIFGKLTFFNKGNLSAKIAWIDLLKKDDSMMLSVDELCLLKYLAQMVWYPSSFLNERIEWEVVTFAGVPIDTSIMLKLTEGGHSVSGILTFDENTSLPVSFKGAISNMIGQAYRYTLFDVNYSDFKLFQDYTIPEKCVVKMLNWKGEIITISMKLTGYISAGQIKTSNKRTKKI